MTYQFRRHKKMGSRVMSWLILVESMSVQHTLHHFPNFVASAATGLPATTASPNSAVRRSGRSVSGTAKAAATPKAASRNPARRRECLIVTIVACCFEPWAKVVVEIRVSKSSCMDGVGFCVPSGLFQVSGGQERRQSFLHFEATIDKTLL